MSKASQAYKRLCRLYRGVLNHMQVLQWLTEHGKQWANRSPMPSLASFETFEPRLLMNGLLTAVGNDITAASCVDTGPVTVATFTDANPNVHVGDLTATIDYGDGNGANPGNIVANTDGSFSVQGDWEYWGQGTYPLNVTINDAGGSTAVTTSNATVSDAPILAGGANVTAAAGTAFTGQVAVFHDNDPAISYHNFTASIDWGDGSTSPGTITRTNTGYALGVKGTHTYADAGSYTVTTDIAHNEDGGSTAQATGTATVGPMLAVAGGGATAARGASTNTDEEGTPTVTIDGASSVNEGAAYQVTLATDMQDVADWTIHWGDGNNTTITAAELAAADGHVSHIYVDGPNAYNIWATATDGTNTYDSNVLGLDTTFNSTGTQPGTLTGSIGDPYFWGTGTVVQSDGKIDVAGVTSIDDGVDYVFELARMNPDGTLDTSFGESDGNGGHTGKITTSFNGTDDEANCVAIETYLDSQNQSQQRIIVAGYTTTPSGSMDFALAGYTMSGQLDATFGDSDGNGGHTGTIKTNTSVGNDAINAITIDPKGNIIVAGYATDNHGSELALARYTSDGVLDTTFGSNASGKVMLTGTSFNFARAYATSLALQPEGAGYDIIVAGQYQNSEIMLARFSSAGVWDASFGGGQVQGLTLVSYSGNGAGGVGPRSLAVGANGKIALAGYQVWWGQNGMDDNFLVARFNANGTCDTGFGGTGVVISSLSSDLQDVGQAVGILSDGSILVGGSADNNFAIGRYNSDGTVDTDFSTNGWIVTDFNNSSWGIYSMAVQPDGRILAAGIGYDGAVEIARYGFLDVVPLTAGALTPPVATAGTEWYGTVFTFTDTDSDADASQYTAVVTLGDGNSVTLTSAWGSNGGIGANADGSFYVELYYTYAQKIQASADATFSVQVTKAGDAMSISASDTNFTVAGTALTAGTLYAPYPAAGVTTADTVLFHFTDSNPNAGDCRATVAWGDGTTDHSDDTNSPVHIESNPNGGFDVMGSHTYPAADSNLTFSVSVSDNSGDSPASARTSITVISHQSLGSAPWLDPTFGPDHDGILPVPTGAITAILEPADVNGEQDIVVAGGSTLVRYKSDGTLDMSFGNGAGYVDVGFAITVAKYGSCS